MTVWNHCISASKHAASRSWAFRQTTKTREATLLPAYTLPAPAAGPRLKTGRPIRMIGGRPFFDAADLWTGADPADADIERCAQTVRELRGVVLEVPEADHLVFQLRGLVPREAAIRTP